MPSFTSIITLASMASVSLAMTVTSPSKFQLWDSAKSNTIKWSSVSTDPQTVDIYLAHMAAHPPLYSLLFSDVPTSKGSADVSGLQLPTGEAYQINLVAHDNSQQILAQSQQFNVTGEAVEATKTVEGYTGPTYSPTASGSKEESSVTKSVTKTASITTIVSTGTDSTGGTVTRTRTSTSSSDDAEATESASETEEENASRTAVSAASGTASSTASTTPNAAAGNFVATGGLAAMFLGVAAFLV